MRRQTLTPGEVGAAHRRARTGHRAADDEFLSEDELRLQTVKLRAGSVARHVEGDKHGP